MRRRPETEELFVLNGMVALSWAAAWIWWRRELLLEYFYFSQLLALTHLVTLGFLSSLMMGVLYRLSPTLLKVQASSRRLAKWQLGLFLIGSWGMVAHFWLGEWVGMSWSTVLVWAAAVVQLWNFRELFRPAKRDRIARRYVASSLLYFLVAATLGVLMAVAKAYEIRLAPLAPSYLANVFAHAHLAGLGWVGAMIFGFQLKLVPTTVGASRYLPLRFALFQVGTAGVALSLLFEINVTAFAVPVAVACVWQAYGPARALLKGRAREWELGPLALLVVAALTGLLLSLGWPGASDPARGRLHLAYGFLAVMGFMVLMVVTVAFKLFPMWVWKERFQSEFGKRPVPGMKELHSETLRRAANVTLLAGAPATAVGIFAQSQALLSIATTLVLIGIVSFVVNFLRVVRWALLNLEFQPTGEDEKKFREMFPDRTRAGNDRVAEERG